MTSAPMDGRSTLLGTYTPRLGDHVWIDPRVGDLWRHDEEFGPCPAFPDGAVLPACGEVTGESWSSVGGAWLTIEYVDLNPPSGWNGPWVHKEDIGLDYDLVAHLPSTTFPGHDESGAR